MQQLEILKIMYQLSIKLTTIVLLLVNVRFYIKEVEQTELFLQKLFR